MDEFKLSLHETFTVRRIKIGKCKLSYSGNYAFIILFHVLEPYNSGVSDSFYQLSLVGHGQTPLSKT